MKKLIVLIIAVSLSAGLAAKDSPKNIKADAKATPFLMGQVVDNSTGETLAGAVVKVSGSAKNSGQLTYKQLKA